MRLARDQGLASDLDLSNRIRQLLTSALREATAETRRYRDAGGVLCYVGIPEARPGLPSHLREIVSSAVAETLDIPPSNVRIVEHGHACGLMAMQAAAMKIGRGDTDVCIAAGVDSYHDADTLEWLDRSGFLKSSVNRNGFHASEAAGACLLAGRSAADRLGLPIVARIVGASTSMEAHAIRSRELCIGEGLSAALRGIIAGLPRRQLITATYCDLNGERYRNEEFTYALLRTQEAFVDAHDYLSPADCWGDVGAASGPLFTALAIAAQQRGYSKGRYPILWAGSECGYRAAVLLDLATQGSAAND
jgi:3-oxoacyl-[acyl-carrier-protein] synthase I